MSPKLLGILAIVATLLIAALIALQVVEMNKYSAEPSVWSSTTP